MLECVATQGHNTAVQGHDTTCRRALGAGGHWAAPARGTARARAGGDGRVGHGAATRPVRAGWAKLGHYAPDPILTQFLDSVLFLSHFLDTVHEPGL